MNFLTASTTSKYAISEFVAIGQKNAVTYSDAAKPMVPNQWTIVDINKYLEKFYNDNNTEALQVVLRHMNAYCHILLPDGTKNEKNNHSWNQGLMRMEIHIKRDMINVSLIRELTRIT